MKLIKYTDNLRLLRTMRVEVWFSYETPIAFRLEGVSEITVSENIWSRTTAKHINQVKKQYTQIITLSNEEFMEKLRIYGG